MTIKWTPTSKISYFNIIAYLEEKWTNREILNFIREVEKVIDQIIITPYMFEASRKQKYIRRGFISKHISLTIT